MKNTLVIIADHYPFGVKESFLEDEVKYLADCFDRIFIISRNTEKSKRKTPSNVFSFSVKKISFSTFIHFAIFLFSKDAISEFKKASSVHDITDILKHIYHSSELTPLLELVCNKYSGTDNITLYSYWLFYGSLAIARTKTVFPGIKAVSRAHGYDLYENLKKNNYIPFRTFLTSNLNCIYFISDHGRKYFAARYGQNKCRYKVSYLGSEKIAHKDEGRNSAFSIVSCSSVDENKRVHLIVEALSEIDGLRIKWTHIGSGTSMNKLKKTAKELLSNNRRIDYYLTGQLPHGEAINYLQNNRPDCFINTSRSEGLPVSIIEAFSLGIPVIAPDIGGVREILDKKTGILMRKNFKSTDLSKAILNLAYNSQKHRELSIQAFNKWSAKFDAVKNFSTFARSLKYRPKRILFSFYNSFNVFEGPSIHVQGIVKSWADSGYNVDLLVFKNNSTFKHPNVRIIQIERNRNPFSRPHDFKKHIHKHLKEKSYMFLYTRMNLNLFFLNRFGLSSVVEANGIIELETRYIKEKYPPIAWVKKKFYLPKLHASLSKMSSVVVITSKMKKYFIEKYSLDEEKIFVSGNGVTADYNHFESEIKKDNSVVFIGNLRKWQGIDKIIEQIITAQKRDIFLKIIGSGELFDEIGKLLNEKGFSNIKLLGKLTHAEAHKEIKKSKIGIIPRVPDKVNLTTGIYPLKLSEYWLAGLPILASDIPDLDIVEKIGGGLNYKPGDYDDFFCKLDTLLSMEDEELKKMGKAGQEYVIKNNTWNSIGKNILDFIVG